MNKYIKTFLGILIILIPALITIGILFSNISQKSFYQESGDIRVKGLQYHVKIYNDEYGVPHIIGNNNDDAFFSIGYLHARDRLWQMDITRRLVEGRLSEIFGNKTVKIDKYSRTIGLGRYSNYLYPKISESSKKIITAYTNGVNAFITSHYNQMPLEFDALNYKPEPWRPENTIMVGRYMGWFLNITWFTDFIMGEIINKVGLEKAREIFPDSTSSFYKKPFKIIEPVDTTFRDSTMENDTTEFDLEDELSFYGSDFFDTHMEVRMMLDLDVSHSGSNSWVIGPQKSESGKPILANDTHLSLQAPALWYEAYIKSNEFEVRGMTIPGAPCVIIGNTQTITWGITAMMNDELDFILYESDPQNPKNYLYQNNSIPLDSTNETIHVKDTADIELKIFYTKDGPVVSNLDILLNDRTTKQPDKLLSFKWTGFEESDEVNTFYTISKARNWDEFRAGLKTFNIPSSNFLYADTNGNIGYQTAAKVPNRTSGNPNAIYPDSNLYWSGFIDFERLPYLYNPPEGFISTANTNVFENIGKPEAERYYISYAWESTSRINKINEFLNQRTKLNIEDCKVLQLNYDSYYSREMAKYIVEAYQDQKTNNEQLIIILEKFKSWNGEMDAKNILATVFNKFFIRLLYNVYSDELGEIFENFLTVSNLPIRSVELLLKNYDSSYAGWIDDNRTEYIETKNDIIRKSLIEALNELIVIYPYSDINTWNWSFLHQTHFKHLFGDIKGIDQSVNIGPFETGGNNTTVNNGEYSLHKAYTKNDFSNNLGPSMRLIIDLGYPDNIQSILSTGQSGQPLHKNYQDQARSWLYGDYKQNRMTETEMMNSNYSVLNLLPQ